MNNTWQLLPVSSTMMTLRTFSWKVYDCSFSIRKLLTSIRAPSQNSHKDQSITSDSSFPKGEQCSVHRSEATLQSNLVVIDVSWNSFSFRETDRTFERLTKYFSMLSAQMYWSVVRIVLGSLSITPSEQSAIRSELHTTNGQQLKLVFDLSSEEFSRITCRYEVNQNDEEQ